MIPRKIHQIWFQDNTDVIINTTDSILNYQRIFKSKIPFPLKYNALALISKNPNYSYYIWNKTKIYYFIKLFYPKYLDLYLNLKYMIQKIDFAKYLILYHYGGFYIDLDVLSLKKLDTFFEKFKEPGIYVSKIMQLNSLENFIIKKFYNYCTNNFFINNGIIISDEKNKFYIDLILEIQKEININNDYLFNTYIFNTTGPSILTNTIYKYKTKYPNIYILDNKYFEPCYGKDLTCNYNSESILFHQHKSFWIENLDSDYPLINLYLKIFFSLFVDSVSFYYFILIRGYKIIYFTILILMYYYNKNR
jgi:mannosyltransferase OCH1-like enzyme